MTSDPPGNDYFIVLLGTQQWPHCFGRAGNIARYQPKPDYIASVPHRHKNKTLLELEKGSRLIFFTFFEKNKKIK